MTTANLPGTGVGISGIAHAEASPRPSPLVAVANDGPTLHELREAWNAYNGDFGNDESLLAKEAGVPDLNVRSNRIRPIVNTGVDFLFGPPLTISTKDKKAQALIEAVWGDSDLQMTLLSKSALNGGIYGHVFFKIVPPKRGKPSADNPPRLVLINPEIMRIEADADDADFVARFVIEYATTDPETRTPMRKRQTITRLDVGNDDEESGPDGLDDDTTWEIQDWEATGMTSAVFRPVGPARIWPYPMPPIVDWQNFPNPNGHWGQRDVTRSLIALNRQLRLTESNINKSGFLQGTPYFYSTGTDTGGIRPTPGRILDLGAADAKLMAVNGAGDLGQLMTFADQLRSDMDEESGIPGVALGRLKDLPRGQVSGISMRLLHASALARNEHKRRLYGQGIVQVCQTVMLVCGWSLADAQDEEIELKWQDPLPNDGLAEAQAAVQKLQLGYSQHTLITETGGDPDMEADYKKDEEASKATAFSQGQGMPPSAPFAPKGTPPPSQGDPGAPNAMPPTNHPAAIAQRAKMVAN